MLNIAIIGLGDISKIHLPAIQSYPHAKLVAVCDIDESLHEDAPEASFYTDYHKMLENESLDCVHICLPHHLHYEATKACVLKGVHVFQEKPLTHTIEQAEEFVRLEDKYPNIKIGICFQNRKNETFEKLVEMTDAGEYGKLIGLKGLVTWFRPKDYYVSKPWRGQMAYAGGGVMINQSIHTLDLMQLLGGEIETIRGSVDHLLDYGIEVEDTATANISFSNGTSGLFFATVANFGNSSVELQAVYEKAKFTIKDSVLTIMNEQGKKEEVIEDRKLPGSKFYYGASHEKAIHQFLDCIKDNSDDYIHVKDAVISMRMIDAIYRSSGKKEKVSMNHK